MTEFIWDTSHYDGHITLSVAQAAKAEGIIAVTHKLTEGATSTDSFCAEALNNCKQAGIEFLGVYGVVRSGNIAAEVDNTMRELGGQVPWWTDFPGFFGQVDLEHWSYDAVSAADGIAYGQQWRSRSGLVILMYASHGQYQSQLGPWDGPLWNADYVSASGQFAAIYPGDNWTPLHGTWRGGWTPYSGKAVSLLQYASTAVIAGLTTSDANAFRGTIEEFGQLVSRSSGSNGGGGTVAASTDDIYNLLEKGYRPQNGTVEVPTAGGGVPISVMYKWLYNILQAVAPLTTKTDLAAAVASIEAAIAAIPGGGTTPVVDYDLIAEKVVAAMKADTALLTAIADTVNDEIASRMTQ
jgi:hypothetical protein